MEHGEPVIEALEREILEETGFTVTVGNLVILCDSIEEGGRHILNLVFAAEIVGGELSVQGDGRLFEAAWTQRDRLSALELYPAIADEVLSCWEAGFSGEARVLGNVWRDV